MEVRFTVPGEPKGKGRPKFRRVGAYTQTYTPKDTVVYENLVRMSYRNDVGNVKLNGAIYANIVAYFPIPASVSKKKRELMETGKILHTKLLDADNLAKAVLDAINHVAYDDDKQVAKLKVVKRYGTIPRVEVTLGEIENA